MGDFDSASISSIRSDATCSAMTVAQSILKYGGAQENAEKAAYFILTAAAAKEVGVKNLRHRTRRAKLQQEANEQAKLVASIALLAVNTVQDDSTFAASSLIASSDSSASFVESSTHKDANQASTRSLLTFSSSSTTEASFVESSICKHAEQESKSTRSLLAFSSSSTTEASFVEPSKCNHTKEDHLSHLAVPSLFSRKGKGPTFLSSPEAPESSQWRGWTVASDDRMTLKTTGIANGKMEPSLKDPIPLIDTRILSSQDSVFLNPYEFQRTESSEDEISLVLRKKVLTGLSTFSTKELSVNENRKAREREPSRELVTFVSTASSEDDILLVPPREHPRKIATSRSPVQTEDEICMVPKMAALRKNGLPVLPDVTTTVNQAFNRLPFPKTFNCATNKAGNEFDPRTFSCTTTNAGNKPNAESMDGCGVSISIQVPKKPFF